MTITAAHPTIPAERHADRLRRARTIVERDGLDAALIGVGPDLEYLVGYRAMPLERLTMLVIVPGREPTLVVPRLEEPAARAGMRTPVEIATWMETDDPHALVGGIVRAAAEEDRGGSIAVSDRLWSFHLLRLQAALHEATWRSAAAVLGELRVVKDADETELLRLAGAAA